MVDQQHRLRIPGFLGTTHARRVRRHSRQRDANGIGSRFQQRVQGRGRDVPFDDVAINEGGVARARLDWYARVRLERRKIWILLLFDRCSVVL